MNHRLFNLLVTGMLLVIFSVLGFGKSKDEARVIVDGTYRVSINGSINDAVKAGNYDWSSSYINDQYFMADQPHEVDIIICHFDSSMSTDAVLKALDEAGLCPATMSGLLTVGIHNPALQLRFFIVELGSVWQRSNGGRVGCLHSIGGDRLLDLRDYDNSWSGHHRFAAVRK